MKTPRGHEEREEHDEKIARKWVDFMFLCLLDGSVYWSYDAHQVEGLLS